MASNRADGDTEPNISKSKSDALNDMSEEEMSQHLALCLKLDAENKINMKNAFNLHLIDIMRHKIKHDIPDLQSASMSLQASSKIYAGRVDALYKETHVFHNQLQTIASNKKVDDREQADDGEEADGEPKERRRTTKSKQSFIASEESVTFKSENSYQNKMPHANFISIKSAFTASRTAPKLLERLPLGNDSCKLFCTTSLLCYRPVAPMPTETFSYPTKRKSLIQKIQNLRLIHTDSESATFCSDVFLAPSPKSPFAAPEMDGPSDDSFYIGSPPAREQQDVDVEDIIDKFSVLDITADVLVKDLSLAVVDANTLDRNRLPPNSALKRVLNTVEKSKLNKTPVKIRKEKPPREPFFNRERVVDKSILKKGRKIELTDNDILQWKLKGTTDGSHRTELFSTLLADNASTDNNKTILKTMHKLMLEYSCQALPLGNKYGKQRNAQLIRPSSFGICMNNNDSNEMGSENSNCVVESFQNLSLQNSPARSDDNDSVVDNMPLPDADSMSLPDADSIEDSFVLQAPILNRLSKSGFFEDDLKSVMVTPPEMAQPITMRIQTQPITLSTGAVKSAIWNIVEKCDVVLSEVFKELQNVFSGEYLPLQYVFTTLLILANEKCLLLENISESDIKITKDIPE